MPDLAASYTGLTTSYKPPTRPTICLHLSPTIPPISNTPASTFFFDAFFTVVPKVLTTLSKHQGCQTYRSRTITPPPILYYTTNHSSGKTMKRWSVTSTNTSKPRGRDRQSLNLPQGITTPYKNTSFDYLLYAFFMGVPKGLTTLSKQQGCSTYGARTINNILLPTTILPITHPGKRRIKAVELTSTVTPTPLRPLPPLRQG
jgi:hypothetical protein